MRKRTEEEREGSCGDGGDDVRRLELEMRGGK